jgi:hypothetical protein
MVFLVLDMHYLIIIGSHVVIIWYVSTIALPEKSTAIQQNIVINNKHISLVETPKGWRYCLK